MLEINKYYIFLILVVVFLLSGYLALYFSPTLNNFVFSNFINSYDPLVKSNTILTADSINHSQKSQDSLSDKSEVADEPNYWKDPRGMFPIFAYNLTKQSKSLTETLRIVEENGINIIINSNLSWMPAPYQVKNAFENLGNTNLRWLVILTNECKNDFVFGNSNDEINSNIKPFLESFNSEYVYGWYIWDEPGRNRELCTTLNLVPNDDYADINRMVKQVRSNSLFNEKLDYVNLYPTYWDGTPTPESYEDYIDAFIASQEYKPRVLSFDHYPWLKEEAGGFRKDFYLNLEIIRKKSLDYNIPIWMVLLSSGHLDYKEPSFEEISMQVYSALAYGAKGIGYYLYTKSWEHVGYTSWILESYLDDSSVADSLHGPLYVPIKQLNDEVQTLGKFLLDLECVEVIHSSDYPNNQLEISHSILNEHQQNRLIKRIVNESETNKDSRTLIAIYESKVANAKNGKYLMVVNKDVNNRVLFSIELRREFLIYLIDKKSGEKEFIDQRKMLSLEILPGAGRLLYIE